MIVRIEHPEGALHDPEFFFTIDHIKGYFHTQVEVICKSCLKVIDSKTFNSPMEPNLQTLKRIVEDIKNGKA